MPIPAEVKAALNSGHAQADRHLPRRAHDRFTDKGTPSPLVQAIRAGNLLFVSGQGPSTRKTREVVSPDIREQTKQTAGHLKSVLAAAGLDFSHVVNVRVVLRNTEDFAAFTRLPGIHAGRESDAHLQSAAHASQEGRERRDRLRGELRF